MEARYPIWESDTKVFGGQLGDDSQPHREGRAMSGTDRTVECCGENDAAARIAKSMKAEDQAGACGSKFEPGT